MTLPIRETIEVANCVATNMSPGNAATVIAHLRNCSLLEAWKVGLIHGNQILRESSIDNLRAALEMPKATRSELIIAVDERLICG